jgi:hypothetical protein
MPFPAWQHTLPASSAVAWPGPPSHLFSLLRLRRTAQFPALPDAADFRLVGSEAFLLFGSQLHQFKYFRELQIFVEICTNLIKMQNKFHLNPFRDIYTMV